MNLAFADRDFYYGDPYFPPDEPIRGLLSKRVRHRARSQLIDPTAQRSERQTRRSVPYQRGSESVPRLPEDVEPMRLDTSKAPMPAWQQASGAPARAQFLAGTTSIEAADAEGWVVSVTPSGGWIPAFIAGNTGIGLSAAHAELRDGSGRESIQRGGDPASGRAPR